MRTGVLFFWVLFLMGCGKNEAVRPIPITPPPPANPPTQAPPPMGGPGGYFPGGYNPGYPPGFQPPGMMPPFRPQMPPGMPSQYYPFLPVDNYFRGQPQTMPYWNQVWRGWQGYAQDVGRSQFDFNTFWYDYCPQIWSGGQMAGVYNSIDINFYEWVSPNDTQFSPYADPGYFWSNYNGMGYQ